MSYGPPPILRSEKTHVERMIDTLAFYSERRIALPALQTVIWQKNAMERDKQARGKQP